MRVVGAGPSGLAAALYLARAGVRVTVYEQAEDVGLAYRGSQQVLENWSSGEDVLAVLSGLGLNAGFERSPVLKATVLGPERRSHVYMATRPVFYRVRRGPEEGCLDRVLLDQALQAGAVIRFGETVGRTDVEPYVIATGPVGHDGRVDRLDFDTDHPDTCIGLLDDELTPEGHTFVLIGGGTGTMTSWRFRNLEPDSSAIHYGMRDTLAELGVIARDARWSSRKIGFSMAPPFVRQERSYLIGARAGLIDALWGMGLRQALVSGVLAARSIVMAEDYNAVSAHYLEAGREISVANRAIRRGIGLGGYEWILDRAEGTNLMAILRRQTLPSDAKSLMRDISRQSLHPLTGSPPCQGDECDCLWCEHGRESSEAAQKCHADMLRPEPGRRPDLSNF